MLSIRVLHEVIIMKLGGIMIFLYYQKIIYLNLIKRCYFKTNIICSMNQLINQLIIIIYFKYFFSLY